MAILVVMNSTIPLSILLMRLQVLKQNSPQLFDRLSEWPERTIFSEANAIDMCAFVSNDSVGLAEHGAY